MPIFEFQCKACANKFDLMIANKDKDKVVCPQCNSADVKQLLSMFATSSGAATPNSCQGCPAAGTGGCGMHFQAVNQTAFFFSVKFINRKGYGHGERMDIR